VCPSFFQQFNDHLVEDDPEREKARANGMRLRQTGTGQHFVNGLQGAASKWRLANSVTGLRYDDSTGVSEGLAESYSAQARVAMSVVAFEAFARIFASGNWRDAQPVVTTNTDNGLCKATRDFLDSDDLFNKLHSNARPAQQRRLQNFYTHGMDTELYAVCVSICNAFAHDAIGGRVGLIDLAPDLQEYILGSIKNYCVALTTNSP
jgi:hypothetical protein